MPLDFTPSDPSKEQVALELPGPNITLTGFLEYSFTQHFLDPSDAFTFTVAADRVTDKVRLAIEPGAEVRLRIMGVTLASGYIDSLECEADRNGGTTFRISGRDRLGHAVDATANPSTVFKPGQTLLDVLSTLFGPFGWSGENAFPGFDVSSAVGTAGLGGQRVTKKGKVPKKVRLHQLQPYPREGVFAFASRVAQRHGLWIWPTADGTQLVISIPDFDQDPLFELRRNRSGTTNVLDGIVRWDSMHQPTLVVADGFSGGGPGKRSPIQAKMVNTAVFTTGDARAALDADLTLFSGARELFGPQFDQPLFAPRHRLLCIQDEAAHTIEQLEHFLRREVALFQRESVTAHYTVQGHGQISQKNGFLPWSVDSTVRVSDELAGLEEPMWILSKTFTKSREGGTKTRLELIRLNTLFFGGGDDSGDSSSDDGEA